MKQLEPQKREVDELVEFFNGGRLLTYTKGEFIIRPYDPPTGVYFIESGYVRTYALTNEGQENIHGIFGPKEVFPIIWAFTGQHRDVFYEAMGECRVYRVTRQALHSYLKEHPRTLMWFMQRMIEHYKLSQDRIDALEQRHAGQRVAAGLMNLVDRFGRVVPGGLRIEPPIRHHDLANMINVSRETATRVIAQLERKRIIKQDSDGIIIRDRDALHAFIEQTPSN